MLKKLPVLLGRIRPVHLGGRFLDHQAIYWIGMIREVGRRSSAVRFWPQR